MKIIHKKVLIFNFASFLQMVAMQNLWHKIKEKTDTVEKRLSE
jgi:hypothetical protein